MSFVDRIVAAMRKARPSRMVKRIYMHPMDFGQVARVTGEPVTGCVPVLTTHYLRRHRAAILFRDGHVEMVELDYQGAATEA